jgi:hypothetical protein
METLIKDIRFGVKSLLSRPGFTVLAVLTLAQVPARQREFGRARLWAERE